MRIFGDGKKRRELCQREENAAAALLEKLRRVSEELTARGVFVRRQTNLNTAEISPMGVGGTCAAAFYPDTLATFTELITALKKARRYSPRRRNITPITTYIRGCFTARTRA